MRVFFIDFEDSFSNNIISFLSSWDEVQTEIINFRKLHNYDLKGKNIILGPGPGHPCEYIDFFRGQGIGLREVICDARRVVGICLGHQLVFSIMYDCRVLRSSFPVHGQATTFKHPEMIKDIFGIDGELKLQRYNSLYVKVDHNSRVCDQLQLFYDKNDELLMSYESERFFTMQFHPESVGTSCSEGIFQAMKRFFM